MQRHDEQRPSDTERARTTRDATGARQGEIILKSPARRAVFIGGLVGIVVLPFLLWLLAG